jgi:hypothetical protein
VAPFFFAQTSPAMKILALWMIFMCSCLTAVAAPVAVEFGGRVTVSDLGQRRGTRVFGYFIFEPGVPSGSQTANAPNLVVEAADSTYFERDSYVFGVYDNWTDPFNSASFDWIGLRFSYPRGYGSFSLVSSSAALFDNNLVPTTIPALSEFDAGARIHFTVDEVQPYRSTGIAIDHLSVIPVIPGSPVVFGLGRRAGGVSFRFRAEASINYSVQVADSLPATNWTTVTNIPPSPEHFVLINDLSPLVGNRFYRVRSGP